MTFDNKTPLERLVDACEHYGFDMVRQRMAECLALGVDVNDTDETNNYRQKTPLVAVCERGMLEMAEYVLQCGGDVKPSGLYGWTALHCAVMSENVALVELLLAHGADVMATTDNGNTTMYYAIHPKEAFNREMTQVLVDGGFDLSYAPQGQTLLHEACRFQNVAAAQFLLDRGADPNARNTRDETPLPIAAVQQFGADYDLVKLLLEHGADPSERDYKGRSLLELHMREERVDASVMRLFIDYGLDVLEANRPQAPLLHAIMNKRDPLTRAGQGVWDLLLESGVDVGMLNERGQTALHVVCSDKSDLKVACVKYLLDRDAKATLCVEDKHGRLPLHCAAGVVPTYDFPDSNVHVLRLLLDSGADVNAKTDEQRRVEGLEWWNAKCKVIY